jgi:3-hydroxyacyl-CoA dehydrogenase/enoyl-CoA hydratase/3-hydroxybutyryl-CoA epimerase
VINYEKDTNGIVVLTIDDPDNEVNMLTLAFVDALEDAIGKLEADAPGGVIVTSGKSTFFAGADLDQIVQAGPDERELLATETRRVKSLLRRLEKLDCPVVAAVNGTALGGGLELALACHHRIAVDERSARYGLPESMLGVLPGAGGVVRTVRLLGIAQALSTVLLAPLPANAKKAAEQGILDELVESQEALLPAARAWIAANPETRQRYDEKPIPGDMNVLPAVTGMLRKQLKGADVESAHAIAAVAVESTQVDFDTAFEIEGRYFVDLVCNSQQAKNMIQAFFYDLQQVQKGEAGEEEPWKATKVAVLGAGMMGAGIANSCARAGLEVVLKDVSQESAEKGREKAGAGREHLLERITATADPADLAGCDLVIEAVFEDVELKHKVLAEAEQHVNPDALLASNTSSLPIGELSKGVRRPEDLVGLHFFSPVEKMPLVEVIRSAHTSDNALARGNAVVRQINKMPIVAADSPGFFTTRVIGFYLDEAIKLIEEGVDINTLDRVAGMTGYAVGPLQLCDELDMRLAQKVRKANGMPSATVDRMVELGRSGRTEGAGFYEYNEEGKRRGAWKGVTAEIAGGRTVELPAKDIGERLMFIQALETVKCFDEGVIASHADANIGSILGIGFPRTTGGVAQFIDQYEGGVAGFVARADELATTYGERFAPPASLRALAAAGEPFRGDRKAVAG